MRLPPTDPEPAQAEWRFQIEMLPSHSLGLLLIQHATAHGRSHTHIDADALLDGQLAPNATRSVSSLAGAWRPLALHTLLIEEEVGQAVSLLDQTQGKR